MNRRRAASWFSNRMVILVFGLVFSAFASSPAVAAQNDEYRWDLVSIDFTTTPITISAGGIDSAKANAVRRLRSPAQERSARIQVSRRM